MRVFRESPKERIHLFQTQKLFFDFIYLFIFK
jgi:hypothetical protein